jgi:hypothetical protein
MRAKKIGFFLSLLLLSSAFMFTVDALPDVTVSFRGVDVTIDLTYPEEAHPNTTITNDITITANTNLTSINIGILIYAPVNSILQLIKNQPLSWGALHENESLPTSEISIPLPEQVNGTLYCNMTVQTEIGSTTHYASYSFYTTRVHTLTFSEMQNLCDELLANYTELQANYTTLLNEYDSLLANYSSLFDNYTTLHSQFDQLSTEYDAKVKAYQTLSNKYNTLLSQYDSLNTSYKSKSDAYNALQYDYNDLNSTLNRLQENYTSLQESHNSLQENYTSLRADYDELNQNYDDLRVSTEGALNTDRILMFIFVITLVALIALIIYLKRGKEEPYVVIRKETVNMKQDENPDQSNQT